MYLFVFNLPNYSTILFGSNMYWCKQADQVVEPFSMTQGHDQWQSVCRTHAQAPGTDPSGEAQPFATPRKFIHKYVPVIPSAPKSGQRKFPSTKCHPGQCSTFVQPSRKRFNCGEFPQHTPHWAALSTAHTHTGARGAKLEKKEHNEQKSARQQKAK